MICVSESELDIITNILKKYVPNYEVRVFGSRYKWTNKDYSDLDIVIIGESKLGLQLLADIRDAFQESDLTFRVDVLDWHGISSEFQKVIEQGYEVIWTPVVVEAKSGWRELRLGEVIQFNPLESIKKNSIAKKIAMEKLKPFKKVINGFELAEFTGGAKFRNGDTLLARITPCLENGKTAQVNILDDGEVGFGSTEFIVLRENQNVTCNDFIYYLAISQDFRNKAIQSMTGTSGRQRVQTDLLQNIIISLPSLPEQQAIATALSTLDNKIDINNQINKKLEETAQAIFKSWFVDFEPFQDGEFEDSELGRIPKGWSVGCIGDYVKIKSGYAFKSAWWESIGVPVIKIKEIDNYTIDYSDISFVSEDKVDAAKEFKVYGGELLIAMTGATIGKFAIVPKIASFALVNQRVGKFFLGDNPVEKLGFIYCILKQDEVYNEIVSRGDGSAQPNISPSGIETIRIILPPAEIITKFNALVKGLFQKNIENTGENQNLTAIRDVLLPKLMSGKIRVSEDLQL